MLQACDQDFLPLHCAFTTPPGGVLATTSAAASSGTQPDPSASGSARRPETVRGLSRISPAAARRSVGARIAVKCRSEAWSDAMSHLSRRLHCVPTRCHATMSIEALSRAIRAAWSAETSVDGNWDLEHPSVGQCAVTALVIQDLFGGDLLRSEIGG